MPRSLIMRSLTVALFVFGKTVNSVEPTLAPKTLPTAPKPLFTQEMVAEWVVKWQNRLGLYEWKIESKIVRVNELPKNSVANIRWSLSSKKATVRVLDYQDSDLRIHEIIKDTELSVVHELVHLSMAKLPLDHSHTELEEETVKRLSMAFMDLAQEDQNKQLIAENKP